MSEMRLETVTPSMARRYLDTQAPNRTVKQRQLANMVHIIETGQWLDDVAPIKFDTLGRLIDGQHRMLAVERTGRPIQVWVHRGVDPAVQRHIDTNTTRSAADLLKIKGHSYSAHIASGARLVMAFEADAPGWSDAFRVMPAEVDDWVEAHPSIIDGVLPAERLYREHGAFKSVGVALYYLLTQAGGREATDEFFDGLSKRTGLGEGSALLALDRALAIEARSSASGHRPRPERFAALIVKGWNAWVLGRTVKALRWATNEDFPEIVSVKTR